MKAPDVNVLVHALREDSSEHERANEWLIDTVNGDEQVGLVDSVLTGFVRVVTNRRTFIEPTPLDRALSQIDELIATPGVIRIIPGPQYWKIFSRMCRDADARGNLISDAAHAAVAVENGGTWVSLDRDFARFPGLRWELPFR